MFKIVIPRQNFEHIYHPTHLSLSNIHNFEFVLCNAITHISYLKTTNLALKLTRAEKKMNKKRFIQDFLFGHVGTL